MRFLAVSSPSPLLFLWLPDMLGSDWTLHPVHCCPGPRVHGDNARHTRELLPPCVRIYECLHREVRSYLCKFATRRFASRGVTDCVAYLKVGRCEQGCSACAKNQSPNENTEALEVLAQASPGKATCAVLQLDGQVREAGLRCLHADGRSPRGTSGWLAVPRSGSLRPGARGPGQPHRARTFSPRRARLGRLEMD